MAIREYYARFSYSDEGPDVFKIGVSFPDLPGCLSCANTRDEAIEMAKDVLDLYLDVDDEWDCTINPPSRLDELMGRNDELRYDGEESFEYVLIGV